MFRRTALGALALIAGLVLVRLATAAGATTCTTNATPSSFSSAVSGASAGDTICLASGSYGTWSGTNKAITVAAASGATPTMKVNLGSGDANFVLDGVSGMGGTVSSTSNVTIRNSTFSSSLDLEGSNHGLLIDHNTLDWPASSGGINSKIFFGNTNSGTLAAPAVTISNNHIANGDLDGVHIGGGSGLQIVGNEFANLCDVGQNHTDNIQFEGGSAVRIAQNYVHEGQSCGTQGITSYDGGTNGVIIEDNVVDIPRDWGIELYQDHGSIVRHNTVVWHSAAYSSFGTQSGHIDINHKSGQACGSGTVVRDNITTGVGNACPVTADHNVSGANVTYVGPTTRWSGFALAGGSAGKGAASDGTDVGIRVDGAPDPTPTPTPSPDPSPTPTPTPPPTGDTPAQAQWTAPTGAVAGTPVSLDGSSSTGDGPLSCVWQFEDASGNTVQQKPGCQVSFTFAATGTKYVTLIVSDADGDLSARRRTFTVS